MKTVFVSGVWDLLHPGHVQHLQWARQQGDRLIVSVAADATVRAWKREPVQGAEDRAAMLRALRCVDEVLIAAPTLQDPHRDCFPLVERLRPAVWALGPDDRHVTEKRLFARCLGVEVVQDPRDKPHSTTALLLTAANRVQDLEPGARAWGAF